LRLRHGAGAASAFKVTLAARAVGHSAAFGAHYVAKLCILKSNFSQYCITDFVTLLSARRIRARIAPPPIRKGENVSAARGGRVCAA
jgi:hypothetical protein